MKSWELFPCLSVESVSSVCLSSIAHGIHGLNRFGTDFLCELRAFFVFFVVVLSPQSAQSFFTKDTKKNCTRKTQIERILHRWRSVEGRKMFRPYRAGSESCFRVYPLNPSYQCAFLQSHTEHTDWTDLARIFLKKEIGENPLNPFHRCSDLNRRFHSWRAKLLVQGV